MESIKLDNAEWKYDPSKQLGPEGGFGAVFAGTGEGYGAVAIKKLKIDAQQAAHRELTIAKDLAGRNLENVITILDSGKDANSDSYFVVMALADKSLQDEIGDRKKYDDIEAAKTLLDIVNGLLEVSDIVHRDLKPGNVLYHEGRWKVADFGIARFVEDSTSLRTLKGFLTPQYAAPEQFRIEHATNATDIYTLGCIGHFLLTGNPPFQGSVEEIKQKHLTESPPPLENHNPQLCSLLTMMLRKAPSTRPNLERVKSILTDISQRSEKHLSQNGLSTLAKVGAESATIQAEEEARRENERMKLEKRKIIAKDAFHIFIDIIDRMFERILNIAPTANCINKLSMPLSGEVSKIFGSAAVIELGQAKLIVQYITSEDKMIHENAFSKSGWDVVSSAIILVSQIKPGYTFSASLWYSKVKDDYTYRWREVSYFGNPLVPKEKLRIKYEPFALKNLSHADEAASNVMDVYQIAYGPKPIDDEDFEDFCQRWGDRLAKAVKGQLACPRQLPLK